MNNLEKECDKHPVKYRNFEPQEFANSMKYKGIAYQKDFFEELGKEYLRQSKGDADRGRAKLSGGLEDASKLCFMISEELEKECNLRSRKLNEEESERLKEDVKEFGYTNYFYQKAFFDELRLVYQEGCVKSRNAAGTLEKISENSYLMNRCFEKICKNCEKYMKNPNYK